LPADRLRADLPIGGTGGRFLVGCLLTSRPAGQDCALGDAVYICRLYNLAGPGTVALYEYEAGLVSELGKAFDPGLPKVSSDSAPQVLDVVRVAGDPVDLG
jgi:hypothetical protein